LICVIDSSVWISALEFDGVPQRALDICFLKHQIAICAPILNEVSTTLSRKFRWPQARIDQTLHGYLAFAIEVNCRGTLHGICRDPNDDMVIECAIAANATAIVSGDKDLLALGAYQGIRIFAPRAFLEEFGRPEK